MVRKVLVFLLMVMLASSSGVLASGYRVPEQSLNSTALSSAYVANANGPDAAYYNPANMAWAKSGWELEYDLNLIYLPSIKYEDSRSAAMNGGTEEEYFGIPTFFATSPEYNNFRFGLAVVSPAGLSKRWKDPYPGSFAEESSMMVIEANPTVVYKLNDSLAIGLGVRLVYSDATLKSNGVIGTFNMTRDMEGDTIEYGYNLALTFKPLEELTLAATYRSQIDLDMEGDVAMTSDTGSYQGTGSVSLPIPDVLSLGVAYTFEKATLEFTYDRTFWSAFKQLDFKYPVNIGDGLLTMFFDDPAPKNWEDVDAYRIGLTYKWSESLVIMVGGGIDGNPVPDSTISFDLPDSDAWFASLGFRYEHNEKLSYGVAYLHADKDERTAADANGFISGTFSDAATHLLVFSLTYLF